MRKTKQVEEHPVDYFKRLLEIRKGELLSEDFAAFSNIPEEACDWYVLTDMVKNSLTKQPKVLADQIGKLLSKQSKISPKELLLWAFIALGAAKERLEQIRQAYYGRLDMYESGSVAATRLLEMAILRLEGKTNGKYRQDTEEYASRAMNLPCFHRFLFVDVTQK